MLPLWLLHSLGILLGWATFLLSPTYRREYLRNAAQAGYSMGSVLTGVGHAGKMVMEIPRLWMGSPVPVIWDGAELVSEALKARKGVIFLTPHMGCFEITAQAYASRFGEGGDPITVLYRPARKRWMRALVEQSRSRRGMAVAPATMGGVKQLARALKSGGCVGLLPDQVPPQGMGDWANFFGRPAYTMTLPVRLQVQSHAKILLAWGERLSWWRGYVVHVRPFEEALDGNMSGALERLNAAMETLIREAPSQYLWAYSRYKQPRQTVS